MLGLVEADEVKKALVTTFMAEAESQVVVHHVGEVAARLDIARTLSLDTTRRV